MVDDAMKSHRIIGMIQPKKNDKIPNLYDIGCAGKITSFHETEDGRYLIVLVGISRFKILEEVNTEKLYRTCKVSFDEFNNDLNDKKEEIKFSDLKFIFKDFRFLINKNLASVKVIQIPFSYPITALTSIQFFYFGHFERMKM